MRDFIPYYLLNTNESQLKKLRILREKGFKFKDIALHLKFHPNFLDPEKRLEAIEELLDIGIRIPNLASLVEDLDPKNFGQFLAEFSANPENDLHQLVFCTPEKKEAVKKFLEQREKALPK